MEGRPQAEAEVPEALVVPAPGQPTAEENAASIVSVAKGRKNPIRTLLNLIGVRMW